MLFRKRRRRNKSFRLSVYLKHGLQTASKAFMQINRFNKFNSEDLKLYLLLQNTAVIYKLITYWILLRVQFYNFVPVWYFVFILPSTYHETMALRLNVDLGSGCIKLRSFKGLKFKLVVMLVFASQKHAETSNHKLSEFCVRNQLGVAPKRISVRELSLSTLTLFS